MENIDGHAGPRVFIVEDEPLIAMDIEAMLTSAGYGVAGIAHDLPTALALVESEKADACVLDIYLHGTTSFCVADRLTERGIPVLLATGAALEEVPAEYRLLPMLFKPFDAPDLLERIEATLAGPSYDESVRMTAYFLWEQDGRPAGRAHEYWLRAEARHRREEENDRLLEIAPDSGSFEQQHAPQANGAHEDPPVGEDRKAVPRHVVE
jgi:DNA-binding response OmpR family regulator